MVKLSILIPVYNEEKTLPNVIRGVIGISIGNVGKEIIIVDDFSTDGTRKILKEIKDKSIRVFYHKKNMGKGAAVRTALMHSSGDIISIQDADLEYKPEYIAKAIRPIIAGDADVVYGSRFLGKRLFMFGKGKTPLPLHWIGNRGLTCITNILYSSSITDMETGCKAFKKEVVKSVRLKSSRFDFEPEITAKILKKGFRIKEIPIEFNPRTPKEGKKITWRDGIKAAYYLLKYRFFD